MFNNKNILITGGTGNLGNKFVIYSRNKSKQYQMQKKFNSDVMRYLIGDIELR